MLLGIKTIVIWIGFRYYLETIVGIETIVIRIDPIK